MCCWLMSEVGGWSEAARQWHVVGVATEAQDVDRLRYAGSGALDTKCVQPGQCADFAQ